MQSPTVILEQYSYHGTVEEVEADKVLVRWLERKEKPNMKECEWYPYFVTLGETNL